MELKTLDKGNEVLIGISEEGAPTEHPLESVERMG
jgi:hypothetical protein